MKRDVVLAPTPRHACARAATSSCETFISLITASCGRPGGHRRAWARRVGARQPDLRCYRCYPRSAPPSYGLSNEPRNCKLNPETGSAAAVFGYPGTAQIDALGWHCMCQNLITACGRSQSAAAASAAHVAAAAARPGRLPAAARSTTAAPGAVARASNVMKTSQSHNCMTAAGAPLRVHQPLQLHQHSPLQISAVS